MSRVILIAERFATFLIPLLLTFYIARKFPTEVFSNYQQSIAFSGILIPLGWYYSSEYLYSKISVLKNKKQLKVLIVSKAITVCVAMFASFATIKYFTTGSVLLYAFLIIIAASIAELFIPFRAIVEVSGISIGTIVRIRLFSSMLKLIGLIAIMYFALELQYYLYFLIVESVITGLMLIFKSMSIDIFKDSNCVADYKGIAIIVWVSTILQFCNLKIDKIIAPYVLEASEVSTYISSSGLFDQAATIVGLLLYYFVINNIFRERGSLPKKSTLLKSTLLYILYVLVSIFATPYLLCLLLGEKYEATGQLLRFELLGLGFFALDYVINSYIIKNCRSKFLFCKWMFMIFFSVGVIYLFTSLYGLYGMVFSHVIINICLPLTSFIVIALNGNKKTYSL